MLKFLKVLDSSNVSYVSWKNNHELDLALSGKTDLDISRRLVPMALQVAGSLIICESGIHSRGEIEEFEELGAHSFLVGESLITAENIGGKLKEFIGDRKISAKN